jgi:hypothetical protein
VVFFVLKRQVISMFQCEQGNELNSNLIFIIKLINSKLKQ